MMPTVDSADPDFWVALTRGQAEQVVRQAIGGGPGSGMLRVLLALGGAKHRPALYELKQDPRYQDRKLSQSAICSVLALTAFQDGEAHGVKAVAEELGMSVTTTHRYLKTWLAIGVLEQDQKTRRYRLARTWRDEVAAVHDQPPVTAK